MDKKTKGTVMATISDQKAVDKPREKGWWNRFIEKMIKGNQEALTSGCKT